ncbi:gliding motility protein [Streptomyces sp. HSW2009]|uniref:gliding motility protein n=1 Tax=Streptomyces sp. HSW2009 TaxID=3142890 RepID=UPI0032EFE21D
MEGSLTAESPAPEESDAPPADSAAPAATAEEAEHDSATVGGATIPKQQSAARAADSEAGEDARQ